MTSVYINYPNPHFAVKHDVSAESRMHQSKSNRRLVSFTPLNLSDSLLPFVRQQVSFNATSELNDMWLELNFENEGFELAVVKYIQHLLGKRYRPLRDAEWRT